MSSAKFSWSRASFQNAATRVCRQTPSQAAGHGLGPETEKRYQPSVADEIGTHVGVQNATVLRRRVARLVVHAEQGAGIEVSFEPFKGFLLERIASIPGQPELREGDVIVAAGGHSLQLAREEDADEVLANALLDGVELEVEGPEPKFARSDHHDIAVRSNLPQNSNSLDDCRAVDVAETSSAREEDDDLHIAPNPEALPTVTSFGTKLHLSDSLAAASPHIEGLEDGDLQSGGSSDSEDVVILPQGPFFADSNELEGESADAPGSRSLSRQAHDESHVDEDPRDIAVEESTGQSSSVECTQETSWDHLPQEPADNLSWGVAAFQSSSQVLQSTGDFALSEEPLASELQPETMPLPSRLTAEKVSEVHDDVPKIPQAILVDAVVEALFGSSAVQVSQSLPFTPTCDEEPIEIVQEERETARELEVNVDVPQSMEALSSTLFAVGLPDDISRIEETDRKVEEAGTFDIPVQEIPPTPLRSCRWSTTSNKKTTSISAKASEELKNNLEAECPPPPRFAILSQTPEVASTKPPDRIPQVLKLEKVSLNEPESPLNLEICLPGHHTAPKMSSCFSRNDVTFPDAGRCKVHELWDWLCELRLQEYYALATAWCIEMGAANLEELAENIDDLIEALALKPIERQRVHKWAAQALANGSCSYGWSADAVMENQSTSSSASQVLIDPRSLASERDNSSQVLFDPRSLASERDNSLPASAPIYTSRSVRLAMDSKGSTGLGLDWCGEWGILVEKVDPLPGQPGLKQGDFIVAIDGYSLRHRTHEECNAIFTERLQDGAVLSIVTPSFQDAPKSASLPSNQVSNEWAETMGKGSPLISLGKAGHQRFPRAPSQATGQLGWKLGGKGGLRRGRGGYDANSMWRRFRGPVW